MYYNTTDTFQNFARKDMNISSSKLDYYEKQMKSFYTPNILETSKEHMINLSIFDKLAKDRILFITNEVNSSMATIVSAQLKYMDTQNNSDITMYIDSPGGCVKSGLMIYDFRQLLNSDLITICVGMGASMGSILTGMGTKGKRGILPNARVMLHQASGGMEGNVQDIKITYEQLTAYNDILFDLLGEFTGKTAKEVMADATRDKWLRGQEAVDYGIVDKVIRK